MSEESVSRITIESWTKCYLNETIKQDYYDNIRLESIIKKCSIAHFEALNMGKVLEQYIGKIDEFLSFLEKEWKQSIDYDKNNGIIIVDENKKYCVCPLVMNDITHSQKICVCSAGFNEKMFSYVLQKPVQVQVVRSWLRNEKSCLYKIIIN